MAMSKRRFLKLVGGLKRNQIIFTEHFKARKRVRSGLSEKLVEDFLLNREKELIEAQKDANKAGLTRFRAFYEMSRKKVLMVVLDVQGNGSLRIVTSLILNKKLTLELMRDADRNAKFADGL